MGHKKPESDFDLHFVTASPFQKWLDKINPETALLLATFWNCMMVVILSAPLIWVTTDMDMSSSIVYVAEYWSEFALFMIAALAQLAILLIAMISSVLAFSGLLYLLDRVCMRCSKS